MTGAERAKLSRIRAKPPEKRTAEDFAFHAELEAKYKKPISLEIDPPSGVTTIDQRVTADAPGIGAAVDKSIPPAEPGANAGTVASPGPGPAAGEIWDRVIDTTGDDDDDDDDDDDGDDSPPPRSNGNTAPRADGAGPVVPDKSAPMSFEVSRGTAASFFLLNSSAWSMLGDRDPRYLEPSDEERQLLSKVFSSYAERYGWTKELDDAILLGTILLVYNARAFKAPRKQPKRIGPGETK